MENIRVAIFEDNYLLRESISLVLNGTDGFVCTGAFHDCNDVIHDIEKSNPDVVLMDIDMPGINGIQAVEMIKEKFPGVLILMQTVFGDDDKIFSAIVSGANGYILKNTPPAELIECIRDLKNGGAPMSKTVAARVLELFRKSKFKPTSEEHHLTPRELEILQMLSSGLSLKLIAEKLIISFFTVQTHVKNIYDKLHVNSKAEAVAKAFRENIL
jgi:DNA-binding NarL/FixJ family response regulator